MIHRFVNLPSVVAAPPTNDPLITYKLTSSTSRNQYWLGGGGATPALIPCADFAGNTAQVSRGRLSPDHTKIVYTYVPSSSTPSEIRVGNVSSGLSTTIATGISAGRDIDDPFWHPDGTKIIYTKESSTLFDASNGIAEIRQVNIDGTGDILLYKRTGADGLPWFNLDSGARYNSDGTLIAWFDEAQAISSFSTYCGVWVMNADGTSPARAISSGGATTAGNVGLLGWSNTSATTFAIQDFDPSTSARRNAVCTTSGSVTNLTSSNLFGPTFDYVWLADDSAIAAANFIYSTEPKGVVCEAAVPSGTVTNLSPEERTIHLSGGNFYKPIVFGNRIYWFNASTNCVESVLDDGSNFRTDHDLTPDSLTFNSFIF